MNNNLVYPIEGISKEIFDYICYIVGGDKEVALGYLGGFEVLFKKYGEEIRNKTLDWSISNVEFRYGDLGYDGTDEPIVIQDSILKGKESKELEIFPEIKIEE